MTAEAVTHLLHARPTGRGRWTAHCPAHEDRSPSLSIATGRDGRILVHCHAGCSTEAVLEAAGLRMADLYAGPSPTSAQARQFGAERARREDRDRTDRLKRGRMADRARKLGDVSEALAAMLVRTSDDDAGATALVRLYHDTLSRLRAAEADLEEMNRG